MTTAEIVLIIVVVVLGLCALGGARVLRRRREAGEGAFRDEIERANRDLAAAHAADNGWEPTRVTESARTAFSEQRPQARIGSLELVQVVDPPGTEDDKAIFHVATAEGTHRLTLGRHGDHWHLESLD
ncbi:MAG: hypothetical protein ACR2NB_11885 [Solirubrobacteraceae bacterium]